MNMKTTNIFAVERDFMINMDIFPRRASFLRLFVYSFNLFSISPSWDPITRMPNPN